MTSHCTPNEFIAVLTLGIVAGAALLLVLGMLVHYITKD